MSDMSASYIARKKYNITYMLFIASKYAEKKLKV